MQVADISKLKNVLQSVVEGYGEKSVLRGMQKRGEEQSKDRDKQRPILH